VELARFVRLLATMFLQLAGVSVSLLLLSSTDLEDGMLGGRGLLSNAFRF
jgi:hypothetical protein